MNKYIQTQIKNILDTKNASDEMFEKYVEFVLRNTYHTGEIQGIQEMKKRIELERKASI